MMVDGALKELSKITTKGIFPFRYEACWGYHSRGSSISILLTHFLEGDIYDIRPYVKEGDNNDGENFNWLWEIVIQFIYDEKTELINQNREVEWSIMLVTYKTVSISPISDSYCDGTNWMSIINMVLTKEKRNGRHES